MKNTPKVLFLARWYPDRHDPMPGLFIKRHAEVAAQFVDVAVLYLRAEPEMPFGFQIEQRVENGVVTTIVYYGTRSAFKLFYKVFAGLLFFAAFYKGYKFILQYWGKPEIIHVNVLTRLGFIALLLKRFQGIHYVITEHWSRYLPITGTYKGLIRKYITKLVVRNSDAVSTVSENLSLAMQHHGLKNRNYMVLPNVVDTDVYLPGLTHNEYSAKRILHISCFEDCSKNISGILRTFKKLSLLRNDFECIMVGEGVDFEKMKSLALSLGLKEPQVTFTGLLENEELVNVYQSADFMLMFSNYENMPVVICESFSVGLPVIATSVGGIPEYINKKNGRLVKPGDEKGLLEAINFMLDNSSEFNSLQIRQYAIDIFSKKAVAEKLKELYSFVKY